MSSFKNILLFALIAVVFPTAIFAAVQKPIVVKAKVPTAIVIPKTVITRTDLSEIESAIGAKAYVVMDRTTGKILTEKNEDLVWPIASTTKLMTAEIVLSKKISPKKMQAVLKEDDVGGAKLYVKSGDKFSIDDLFYAMLIGSANNAANALARSSGLSRTAFVEQMNARAKELGLTHTVYVDPSGIDTGNVSTPIELAKIANIVFANDQVKKYTTTPVRTIVVANTGTTKKIQSTNWMLTKPAYRTASVTGGKTGYLNESGWNFVTTLRPTTTNAKQELLIVIFGAESRAQSFQDATKLSNWAWKSYAWK